MKPPAVRPRATVGIVATSSPVREEFVDRGVAELTRLGFRARLGSRLFERDRYTAGTGTDRLADWNELWRDPEVAAIFCARGGYGALQLLPALSVDEIRSHPKVVLGSSDVTALLAFLGGPASLVTFHGPMVAQQIARGDYDRESLTALLGSSEPFGRMRADTLEMLHRGACEGRLAGGCLSLVTSMVGTPYLRDFEDVLLFLEDADVKPYQIDRMLTQLRLSGLLDRVRGIVFGQMPGCQQHPQQGYTLQEMLRDWTAPLRVPVAYGFPSGHTLTPAMTLPLGVRARLDKEGLAILEGAVR
ncbi:MAG TPA: LD-carboxypeptidase [Vicinamibacteria bacterium]|nr:LD-carboxypeptidase [Vicinamibacteria bacterium]